MSRIILPTDHRSKVHRRFAIFSEPKHGKSRLATALPWGPLWGDFAAYIAWDPGSETLDSTLAHHRAHIIAVQPGVNKDGKWDPHTEAVNLARRDWAAGGPFTYYDAGKPVTVDLPPCGTIIWDTMTATARDLLYAYADTGVFQGDKGDKHVAVGVPGSAAYMAAPMQGDYGFAQRTSMQLIATMLFKQRCNVIVLFHAGFIEPEGGIAALTIGPATAGKASIRDVAGLFDNLFRLDVRSKDLQTQSGIIKVNQHIVHTQKRGAYLAGIRTDHKINPIPEVVLEPDPVNFWEKVDEVQGYTTKAAA